MWKEMYTYALKNHIQVSDNTFTIYHDKEYKEKDVDIEVCAPVVKMNKSSQEFAFRNTELVPLMACTMVYGPFSNIAGAFLAFANWLEMHNQYRMGEHSRQIVHRGPWNEENPQQFLTEIQIPLKIISVKPRT